MTTIIDRKVLRSNPALKPFEVLLGEWQTTGSHPYLRGIVLHGRVSFDWLENGAFLIMRSEVDNPKIPDGIAIFGSDDEAHRYFMLYFDERGVSRKYDVSLDEQHIMWRRDDSKFSQGYTLTIENDSRMIGKGEMSRDGAAWENDLALTYTRKK